MKTIIWKELREHARWVPLGLIPMIIILVLRWRSNELIFDGSEHGGQLGLSVLVGLVASGVALCLGLLQSWSDQRPAARALLLHRGITADAAFYGKLLAGLLLYGASVWVPLLGMAAFTAWVGIEHRAASPGALLPAALISMAAFSFWPTGLLVVRRDAWFVGSRLLPSLTAAMAVFACGVLMYQVLWIAMMVGVLTLVAFIAAARSVFVNSGQVAIGVGRVGLTLAVTVALLTMTMCLVGMIETYQNQAAYASGKLVAHRYGVEFGPDGSPWLARLNNSWNGYRYEFDQLLAKMVPGKSVSDNLKPAEGNWEPLQKWSPVVLNHMTRAGSFPIRFQRVGYFNVSIGAGKVGRTWVYDNKIDAILVYRDELHRRFQLEAKLMPPASVGSFGEIQNWGISDKTANFTLVTTTGVFLVPYSAADISLIYSWPQTAKYRGLEMLSRPESTDPFSLVVRLDDRVVLLENGLPADAASRAKSLGTFVGLGEVFATEVRLPAELAKVKSISIARNPNGDGSFLGLVADPRHNDDRATWYRFSEDGQIKGQVRYGDDTKTVEGPGGDVFGVALIPPSAFAFGLAMMAIENSENGVIQEDWEYVTAHPAESAMAIFLGMLQPIVGILLALWAARRRAVDKRIRWWWICWAFWFGPYGSLAILAVYPRIVREPCPACQKAARTDVASCEHCACPLDELPMTGIEIFDRGRNTPAITTQPASV